MALGKTCFLETAGNGTGKVHFAAGKDGLGEGGGDSFPRKTNEPMPTPPETLGGEAHAWLPRQGLEVWGEPQSGGVETFQDKTSHNIRKDAGDSIAQGPTETLA